MFFVNEGVSLCTSVYDTNITDFILDFCHPYPPKKGGYYFCTWWQVVRVISSDILCVITTLPQGELLLQLWTALSCPAPWTHETSSCNLAVFSTYFSISVLLPNSIFHCSLVNKMYNCQTFFSYFWFTDSECSVPTFHFAMTSYQKPRPQL